MARQELVVAAGEGFITRRSCGRRRPLPEEGLYLRSALTWLAIHSACSRDPASVAVLDMWVSAVVWILPSRCLPVWGLSISPLSYYLLIEPLYFEPNLGTSTPVFLSDIFCTLNLYPLPPFS